MSNDLVGAPGELQPQVAINFSLRASLARTMSAPVIVDGIVGLAIFGNSSAIYLAHVPDKGGDVYAALPSVTATTYIHGWTVQSGKLYVLDGVELVNIVEVIAILIFFVYMAGRLRTSAGTKKGKQGGMQPTESPSLVSTQGTI